MMVWRWWSSWPATTASSRWCSSATRSEGCSASASLTSPHGTRRHYVGASQVVNWALQEERSYDWALQEARRTGNLKAQAALDQIGRPVAGKYATGTGGVTTQRRWLGALGGVAADPRFVARWALSVFTSRGYPHTAKVRYLKAMDRSMDLLWPHLCEEVDFSREALALDIPVHLFAGRQDRITDLAQIEEWFQALDAPAKRLEVVDDAGHLTLYEKPDRFITFMDQCARAWPDTHPGLLAARARLAQRPAIRPAGREAPGATARLSRLLPTAHRHRALEGRGRRDGRDGQSAENSEHHHRPQLVAAQEVARAVDDRVQQHSEADQREPARAAPGEKDAPDCQEQGRRQLGGEVQGDLTAAAIRRIQCTVPDSTPHQSAMSTATATQ